MGDVSGKVRMSTNFDLAVIICTHNPRPEFIRRTIEGLQSQDLPSQRWQLVLIDNASSPRVDGQVDLGWHPNAQCITEPRLGLTRARMRGIRAASARLLVFVDDDNVLSPSYLTDALAISDEYKQVGAFGGQCFPDFVDGPPPEWTRNYWSCLALWEFDQDFWSNRDDVRCLPCGAGMIVHNDVASQYCLVCDSDPRRSELDRKGLSLMSGGDYDLALCAVDLGLGIGKFRRLKLHHLMPLSRFEEKYLIRLWRSVHCSAKVLNYLRCNKHAKFTRTPIRMLRRLVRIGIGGMRNVHFRFGIAAEEGLRDADKIIGSLQQPQ